MGKYDSLVVLRGFQIDSWKDAYEMNDDTSTYISDLLSFIWGPLEKRKKKESDFTQSMYGISFRRPSLQRVVSIHLILSPGISKKCLLKELMVQHFGWTADWWEETTHTVRWAEVLNSISQGNKIILKVRQLHLDAISQHIFPPSPEPPNRGTQQPVTLSPQTVSLDQESSTFVIPLSA